ncbi:hypothetical protein NE236_11620 [Actinoallomurus purpureus]|uniref:hypothetical protein n=1 Tax=Actinoallomurus purpureus TaxID=478114 RepID=UPI002092C537|nr:hypothetical protein [Actinoallomurus purpureus]MCO6005630.1 hypothetical protein [Actinoallomurus purpureus]
MPEEPPRFPSHPIREVEARYVKQAVCGVFAVVTVDFEPGHGAGNGIELAIPTDVCFVFGRNGGDHDYRVVFGYLDAFAKGMLEELAANQQIIMDAKVILRRMVIHDVDSNERSFHTAGKMAARTALERALDGCPAETSQ